MNKIIQPGLIGLAILLLAVACSSTRANDSGLVVFAAASLTGAFRDAAAAFQNANPSVKVTLNFAGSQRLRTQLEHGASADLFASADWQQMDRATEAGLVKGDPVDFTSNHLVMVTYAGLEQGPDLSLLAEPGVRVIIAEATVPVGWYTRTILNNMQADPEFGLDYVNGVLQNVVSEEANVRNVVQKVALGEADAGIVYASDAVSADITSKIKVTPIPPELNVTASYPIAILKDSPRHELAQQFIDFLLSEQGQQVLQKHGFGVNPPESTPDGNAPSSGRLSR